MREKTRSGRTISYTTVNFFTIDPSKTRKMLLSENVPHDSREKINICFELIINADFAEIRAAFTLTLM